MFDWHSELVRLEHQAEQELDHQIDDLARFLAKQSATFREDLPDPSLQDIYDRQIDQTKPRGAVQHVNSFFQTLENQIQWFDANLHDLPQGHELRILLGTRHIAWEYGTVEEKRELLNQFRAFAERFYEAATKGLQKQWAEARRSGKQEELFEKWKRQMLQRRLASSSSGTGQSQSKVEEDQRSTTRPERGPELSTRTPTRVTWVEFQLIDEVGKPVPNTSYRIQLPDGSIRNGHLDGLGIVRFDNIDVGQCQITFTEIDAREWQPI